MKRLIVFGPSTSYGVGLDNPDRQVWGGVLSALLHREFTNNSVPGASNKLICHQAINFKYAPDDLVIISWAFHDRYSVLKSEVDYRNYMPSDTDEYGENYYRYFHEDYDHIFLSKVFINYTVGYLSNKKIEVYSLFDGKPHAELLDDKSSLIPINFSEYDTGYPRALDNVHVGAEGHKDLGNMLYRFLQKSVI